MIIKTLEKIKEKVSKNEGDKTIELIDKLIADIKAKKYDDLFMTVLTSRLGRKGGSSTSERKAAASRANGMLGGRPKRKSNSIQNGNSSKKEK